VGEGGHRGETKVVSELGRVVRAKERKKKRVSDRPRIWDLHGNSPIAQGREFEKKERRGQGKITSSLLEKCLHVGTAQEKPEGGGVRGCRNSGNNGPTN